MRINLHGVLAALTSLAGVVCSPAVASVLPPKAAAVVTVAGVVYAAFAKPAVQTTTASSAGQ